MTSQKIRMPHGVKSLVLEVMLFVKNINLEQFMNNTKNGKENKAKLYSIWKQR